MIGKFVLLAGFILSFCFVGIVSAIEFKVQKAMIVGIEDGDTFYLYFTEDPDRIVHRANLKGVDAAGWEEDGGACFAKEAKEFLAEIILGEEVSVSWDSGTKVVKEGTIHQRLLIYISRVYAGVDVNALVLLNGYGWVPRKYPADMKEIYLFQERAARLSKRGLWGACPAEYLSFRPKMN